MLRPRAEAQTGSYARRPRPGRGAAVVALSVRSEAAPGRAPHTVRMAFDAMSPLGLPWGWLALLVLPLLLAAATTLVVIRRRDVRPRLVLLLVATVAAAVWMLLTVGGSVMVPIPEDPQGADCLVNPFGDNPSREVSWESDCGRALAQHLAVSAGPSLFMLGAIVIVAVRSVRAGKARTLPQ